MPITPATTNAFANSNLLKPLASAKENKTAGRVPLAPAVGAATIRPIAAFASPTAKAIMIAFDITLPTMLLSADFVLYNSTFFPLPPTKPPIEVTPVRPISTDCSITSSISSIRTNNVAFSISSSFT